MAGPALCAEASGSWGRGLRGGTGGRSCCFELRGRDGPGWAETLGRGPGWSGRRAGASAVPSHFIQGCLFRSWTRVQSSPRPLPKSVILQYSDLNQAWTPGPTLALFVLLQLNHHHLNHK